MPDVSNVVTSGAALTVVHDGVTTAALTITGALYIPTQGDAVVTLPLSDGNALILGPAS